MTRDIELAFLGQFPFFEHWNVGDIETTLLSTNKMNLPINHVIYKEGDMADTFYFIKKGEVEVNLLS